MVHVDRLIDRISYSGMSLVSIAGKMGLNRATLRNKLNAESEFSVSEAVAISQILHLSEEERDYIFFAPDIE